MKTPIRILALLGGLIAVALIVWVALDSGDSKTEGGDGLRTKAEIVSVQALRRAVAAESTPVYWAGAIAGSELELSSPSPERTYVRYLPAGVEAGDKRRFLTVGSYRFENATKALHGRGQEPGGVLASAPGSGTVYFNREDPKSVYVAYPGAEVEVEVFAPEFKRALQLVTDGRIVPIE